ncbi:MAG: hypothetical protein ACYTE3_08110 [Planctomycetota bacterium]|jgi:hypothetical protein
MRCRFLLVVVVLSLSLALPLQAGDLWWPGPEYPTPRKDAAPAWLLGRKINFSRWDGGPLEVCKGMLSGWPYFNAPWPDVVDATSRWYDPETIDLVEAMGFNFIWLTFNVGYSIEKERHQWELLGDYVKACHERGIKVAAYLSSTNMFVDDMFVCEPRSKGWQLLDANDEPVPYGSASYARIGRITRVRADITNPEWKAYMKRRIDAVIDAGFDAIEYDNTWWVIRGRKSERMFAEFLVRNEFVDTREARFIFQMEVMKRLCLEMLDYARKRKGDMVIMVNSNRPKYTMSRACNVISTEDGYEPGYYSFEQGHEIRSTDSLEPVWEDEFVDIDAESFDAEKMVTNLGRLRLLKGLDEGWKPVIVEFGGRRNGHRFLNHYPPLGFQLAVGECNAALASLQGFQEGLPLLHLYERKPEVMKIAAAANRAHRFVGEHQRHFVGARYKGDVALITDDRLPVFGGERPREGFLTDLVRANVQFDVVFEDRISQKNLRRYQCVVVYDAKLISDRALDVLVRHARDGGRTTVYGQIGAMDRWGQPRQKNPMLANGPWDKARNDTDLMDFVRENTTPSFEVVDCPYVLFTITRTGDGSEAVHLLNYRKHPLENVRVRYPGGRKLRLLALTEGCDRIREGALRNEWIIPRLGVYSILVATD